MRLLIVEDDETIRRLVQRQLESRGITVAVAANVSEGLAALRHTAYETVILDLSLPDGSGLDILKDLRESGSIAHVIILSGAATEADRVHALQLGADDYVVKPFFARELAARVLAVGRRHDSTRDTVLQFDSLQIDLAARRVTLDGSVVELTAKEFDLLAFLAARPGHMFTRDELLRSVWQSASDWQQPATVTEHIRRVRSKIEIDPQQPQLVATVRGAGYRFDPPAVPPDDDTARLADTNPDAARSGIVIHVNGRIVSADAVALSLVGLTREADVLGTDLFDLVAPASQVAARARIGMTGSGLSQRSQVVTILRPDGAEALVEVTSSTIDWEGQIAGRIVVTPATDPASRLRHFATGVFSELSEAVIVTDLHAHVRSWNAAAERLYGWTESEVLGRHIIDLVPWRGDDAKLAATWLSLEEQGRWYGEGRQVTRDGSLVAVYASTTLIRDDAGEPIGIVSVNRPVAAPDALASLLRTPMQDEARIKRGIDDDEFAVYYQPVVALDDFRVITVEALLRWNHPDRGLLAPAAFMDTAERTGLVLELGSIVFDKACRQVARWRDDGADLELAVNLSAKELADPGLVDRVAAKLESSGLDPHTLWLEVTETALVEDVDQASDLLHRLAALGIRIAIDDFGTGWASLTYLRQFPVHALKIDRIFVEGIDHNPHDAAIARSIISLGYELGLTVVAEGIETISQQDTLKAMGCALGQGFLYGKPTTAGLVPIARVQSF